MGIVFYTALLLYEELKIYYLKCSSDGQNLALTITQILFIVILCFFKRTQSVLVELNQLLGKSYK